MENKDSDAYIDDDALFVISEVVIDSEPSDELESSQTAASPTTPIKKRRNSNERERWRHRNVNTAYESLGKLLPVYPLNKKLKKKEILVRSIKYIKVLQRVLQTLDNHQKTRNGEKISTTLSDDMRPIYAVDSACSPATLSDSSPAASPEDLTQYTGSSSDSSDELDQLLFDLQSIS
ncbi:T-cell acute lymphocytic leukemia protein 1 homolog [Paramacrobiotus metropolitanus]|uniref:T-cell acute lymphocytic leukemia protein 1 homolog n=1 Tax=Paramacrobiotus metropolitanus TaxID=2943436 RepID=UPI002445B3E5|nr:T-cell acute lymphocytic leukemia protein 1 homolog [Paramacrobiotus metropolitanus]